MSQYTNLIITIANAIWCGLMVWGLLRGLKPKHNEVAFFTGNAQDVVLQAKNYALHYGYEIMHTSIVYNHQSKQPGEFTLIVTYKTKK
jgi:hypothetical protein